jgi:hypothetical protein
VLCPEIVPYIRSSVADPDPGSGASLASGPESGKGFFRIPDPKHIFLRASDSFLDKKFYNSLKIGSNFFLQHFENKIFFCDICGYKKRYNNNFFSPLSFVPVFESGMGKNQDPGSGINIPDPQH